MKIYVGNLSDKVTEKDLRQTFESFGEVTSVRLVKDKPRGKPQGAGCVTMPNQAEAQSAISNLKRRNLKGKPLKITGARAHCDGGRRGGSRRSAGDKVGGTKGSGRHS